MGPQGMSKCFTNNTQCILDQYFCDGDEPGKEQCNDKSDEDSAFCQYYTCPYGFRKCQDGLQWVPEEYFCDKLGDTHCRDKSDDNEKFCQDYSCPDGWMKCRDGLQCVQERYFCDMNGFQWCTDGSDEDRDYCQSQNCTTSFVKCDNNVHCIREDYVCDCYIADCEDGSDEKNCPQCQNRGGY